MQQSVIALLFFFFFFLQCKHYVNNDRVILKMSIKWFIIYSNVTMYLIQWDTRKGEIMSTSNLIKELCKEKGISVSELARRIGQTPQNFSKKLKRETVSTEELMQIAEVLGVVFEQSYILGSGKKLTITSESQ